MTQLYALEYNGFEGQAADFIKAAKNPHIYKDLFLAKTPYLIFDFASIAILFQFAKKKLIEGFFEPMIKRLNNKKFETLLKNIVEKRIVI